MTTPAGWYDDPGSPPGSGQLRWWDGGSWTAHTRGRAQPVYPAQQYRPTQYGYGKPTSTPDGVPLAGVWARLLAKILDGLLLGALNLIATLPTWGGLADAMERYGSEIDRAVVRGGTPDPFSLYTDPGYQTFLVWSVVAGFLISAVYTVLLLRFKGATLGKLALGMRVRRWDHAGQLGWGACLVRWAVETLPVQLTCGLWFFVDSLWCTWDERRQTLHDKAARTVVVGRR